MKKAIIIIATLLVAIVSHAQDNLGQIALFPYVEGENISDTTIKNLTNRMRSLITANGYGISSTTERLVLKVYIEVTGSSVAPTNPPRVSKNISVGFIIGDIFENHTFSSCTMSLNGIGTTDDKAIYSAFSSISPSNKELSEMLKKAQKEINTFYSNNTDYFFTKAKAYTIQRDYDGAIAYIMSLPSVNEKIIADYQNYAIELYSKKVDAESSRLLNNAKAEWTGDKTSEGAAKAASYLKQVNIASSCYPDALKLWEQISDKLDSDEKANRAFALKQYEDKQSFKKSIINACEAIGTSFGDHQAQNVTKIIRGWR